MVETSCCETMANQHIVATENRSRINLNADKWWINMLSVVKLRQKGTTMVSKLPIGVFRHLLEYKFPNECSFRYSEPYAPIKKEQDRHYPATDKLSYDNYLVAINELHHDS